MAKLVGAENDRIEAAYDKALAREHGEQSAISALSASSNDLDDDFEDEAA